MTNNTHQQSSDADAPSSSHVTQLPWLHPWHRLNTTGSRARLHPRATQSLQLQSWPLLFIGGWHVKLKLPATQSALLQPRTELVNEGRWALPKMQSKICSDDIWSSLNPLGATYRPRQTVIQTDTDRYRPIQIETIQDKPRQIEPNGNQSKTRKTFEHVNYWTKIVRQTCNTFIKTIARDKDGLKLTEAARKITASAVIWS